MKKLILFLCLLGHAGLSEPSATRIDSLKRALRGLDSQPKGYVTDTLRCQTLKAIMRAYTDVNIDSSAHYNDLIIKLCNQPALRKELIYAYQYLGYLYQVRGDYYQSIRFHYKALSLAEELKQYTRMARSYGALAHAYTSLKEYTKAIKLGQTGLRILRKYPDVTVHLPILNVFGAIYREQGRLVDALKVNQEMYRLAQRERIPWYEAQGLHSVGWVYLEKGDTRQSLDYLLKALVLARKIGSGDLEESILLHIADVYIRQQQWRSALAYCNIAKQTALHLKNSSIVAEADEKLYKIYRQTSEWGRALKAHEAFVALKDSLLKEKTDHRIETLRALYDNVQKTNVLQTERINRQAEKNYHQLIRNGLLLGAIVMLLTAGLLFWNNRQLQGKNREIDRQRHLLETAREQLADSNRTLETRVEERTQELVRANQELIHKNEEIKAALFKGQTIERKRVALELHDNLSSLLSAVNMSIQSINPQNLSEPEQSVYRNVKQLIQNAYAEVRNISHNILPAELEREGLAPTLATLVNRLNQAASLQFSLTLTGLQERLPVEIEFNVYSIVLELLNNAIKHARASLVTISLFRTDSGITVSVADDGVGIGHSQPKRGVGLQNIQTRLDSLGGTFTTLLPTEKGTRILIKIPIEAVSINGNIRLA